MPGESHVFDLIYPSPPTLQELSSITISLQLCRYDLSERRSNGTLYDFSKPISVKEFLPNLPMAIETMIKNHTEVLLSSISSWENQQYTIGILEFFDDFVCDFDGAIHHTKTAKRMMLCDQFTEMEKFRIACYNCFEDDIRLLWPSVSGEIDDIILRDIEDELMYWICSLRNRMYEFCPEDFVEPEEWMLKHSSTPASAEFFWNRISWQHRYLHMYDFSVHNPALFVRFYLPKLNELEWRRFVAEGCDFFVIYLLGSHYSRELSYIIPAFMHIKDRISADRFCTLILSFLEKENQYGSARISKCDMPSYVYCELWNNASCNFKSAALELIFSNDRFRIKTDKFDLLKYHRPVIFLKRLLLDATFEQRRKFWQINWLNLITSASFNDCNEIMKLCFSNEADVDQFSENTVANSEGIHRCCIECMRDCDFKVVDDFLIFWFRDVRLRRKVKQRLLQTFVFERNLIPWNREFHAVEELDSFINDAFDSAELANEFKIQTISSPFLVSALKSSIPECKFASLEKFIGVFENESTQRVIAELKSILLDALKDVLKNLTFWETKRDGLNEFLSWCLGGEDQVAEFKRSLPVDEILLACRRSNSSENLDDGANEHLLWVSEFLIGAPNTLKNGNEFGGESFCGSEKTFAGRVDEPME